MKQLTVAMALTLFGAAGCGSPVVPVASHVTQIGPDQSVDDVWVLHQNVLKRCSNTASGPVCVPAQDAMAAPASPPPLAQNPPASPSGAPPQPLEQAPAPVAPPPSDQNP